MYVLVVLIFSFSKSKIYTIDTLCTTLLLLLDLLTFLLDFDSWSVTVDPLYRGCCIEKIIMAKLIMAVNQQLLFLV